jgi:hypothetical protein
VAKRLIEFPYAWGRRRLRTVAKVCLTFYVEVGVSTFLPPPRLRLRSPAWNSERWKRFKMLASFILAEHWQKKLSCVSPYVQVSRSQLCFCIHASIPSMLVLVRTGIPFLSVFLRTCWYPFLICFSIGLVSLSDLCFSVRASIYFWSVFLCTC